MLVLLIIFLFPIIFVGVAGFISMIKKEAWVGVVGLVDLHVLIQHCEPHFYGSQRYFCARKYWVLFRPSLSLEVQDLRVVTCVMVSGQN